MSRETTILDYLYSPDTLSWDARFAEVLHLRKYGASVHEILPRLNLTYAKLYYAATRYGRPDVLAVITQETETK